VTGSSAAPAEPAAPARPPRAPAGERPGVALPRLLSDAAATLRAAGVASPDADARMLAAHALGVPRSRLAGVDAVGSAAAGRFAELIGRRARREPLQHITGSAGFRHLTLAVGPGVFVPRPETELVAGFAVEALGRAAPVVVDLCTGSGAIALAVAQEVPGAEVHALDVDDGALAWARRNVADTGLAVTLHRADLGVGGQRGVPGRGGPGTAAPGVRTALAGLAGRVDCVVANPPYLSDDERDAVEPEVGRHDPELALWAGRDGLDGLRAAVAAALFLLRPGGLFVAEHGDAHGRSAPGLLAAGPGWTEVADHDDLAGRPRFVTARRAGTGRSVRPARHLPDGSGMCERPGRTGMCERGEGAQR
jgi:release factor glutamine methyltransferase